MSSTELSLVASRAEEAVRGLQDLGNSIEHYDHSFAPLVAKRLDPNTH